MGKEFCVWGFNKTSKMSGHYLVSEELVNKIQKGTIFFSEHLGEITEIESMGIAGEVIDTGRYDDIVYYSGKIVGLK